MSCYDLNIHRPWVYHLRASFFSVAMYRGVINGPFSFFLGWVHSVQRTMRINWVETLPIQWGGSLSFSSVVSKGRCKDGRVNTRLMESEKTLGILESPPHAPGIGDLSPMCVSGKSLTCIRQDTQFIFYSPTTLHWDITSQITQEFSFLSHLMRRLKSDFGSKCCFAFISNDFCFNSWACFLVIEFCSVVNSGLAYNI